MGVATGCGFKETYRFPHTTYPYSSCICTILQQHPYFFVYFFKCFSFLFSIYLLAGYFRQGKLSQTQIYDNNSPDIIYFWHFNLRVYVYELSKLVVIIHLTHVEFRRLIFFHQDQVVNLANIFPCQKLPAIWYLIMSSMR